MLFRICKMIASSGFLTALECTKFSARALPRTPLGELTSLPRLPSWFKEDLLLRGRGGKGKRMGGTGREGERRGREGRRREGEGRVRPLTQIPGSALVSDAFRRHISVSNQSNRLRCNKLLSEIL